MKTALSLVLALSSVSAFAGTDCTSTFTTPAGAVIATSEQKDIEWVTKAYAIPNSPYQFTMQSVRTGIDSYDEFVSVDLVQGKKITRLTCKESFVFEKEIFAGVKSVCAVPNATLEVVCKY